MAFLRNPGGKEMKTALIYNADKPAAAQTASFLSEKGYHIIRKNASDMREDDWKVLEKQPLDLLILTPPSTSTKTAW